MCSLHGAWPFAGGAGGRLLIAVIAGVCSRHDAGQTMRAVAQSGVVEGPVERCWSAEGVRLGWSRARRVGDGGNGSCFGPCCYWVHRAERLQKYVPQALLALGVRAAVVAIVAPAALARVSHCGNETFSWAPQPAALLCRLPCCATTVHLRS